MPSSKSRREADSVSPGHASDHGKAIDKKAADLESDAAPEKALKASSNASSDEGSSHVGSDVMKSLDTVTESFTKLLSPGTEETEGAAEDAVGASSRRPAVDRRGSLEVDAAGEALLTAQDVRRTVSVDGAAGLAQSMAKFKHSDGQRSSASSLDSDSLAQHAYNYQNAKNNNSGKNDASNISLPPQHPYHNQMQGAGHGSHHSSRLGSAASGVAAHNFSSPNGSVTLGCPPHLVGRVIGRKGDTIQRLQEMTGTRIVIDQNVPNNAPRHIIVSGPTLHAVSSAVQLVQEVMANGPPWRHKILPAGVHPGWGPLAAAASGGGSLYSPMLMSQGHSSGSGAAQPNSGTPLSPSAAGPAAPGLHPHMQFSPIGQSPPASYAFYQHTAGGPPPGSASSGWMPSFHSGWTGTGTYFPQAASSSASSPTPTQQQHSSAEQTLSQAGQQVVGGFGSDAIGQWQECRTPEGYVDSKDLESGREE